jgi:hypothetical protein
MKKSNKILLGGFLAVLLLIIAVHLTLYAKYNKGDHALRSKDAAGSFQNIKFVFLRNVAGATVRFGDVAQVNNGEKGGLQFVQSGDTLLVNGNYNAGPAAVFSLPYGTTLSILNSSVSFKAGEKALGNNPVIYLQNSKAVFGAQGPLQFGRLKLVALENSTALFVDNVQADDLEVRLSGSTVEDIQGNFKSLTIITDSISRISLQSKHLLKANIKTITPE